MPPHLNCVGTLPCEIVMSKSSDNSELALWLTEIHNGNVMMLRCDRNILMS